MLYSSECMFTHRPGNHYGRLPRRKTDQVLFVGTLVKIDILEEVNHSLYLLMHCLGSS